MGFDILIEGLSTYILVFCRIGGMIFFNPLLSRRNLPPQFRVALALGITILLTPTLAQTVPVTATEFVFMWSMMKELFVGVCCGFVFQIFYYMLFAAGDIIDMGFGLSMAKAFDPGSNIQISMSGNFFQMLFVMYIFATNSHLVFIELMCSSYNVIGMGAVTFSGEIGHFIVILFQNAFSLMMQLIFPFIAASFILEISMGVLMKLIPQINVFSIHFQFKIVFGLVLLFLFAEPTALFIRSYISTMFSSIQQLFTVL